MQEDDAVFDEKVPAEHSSHSVAPVPLNVPAKHTEQIVDPDLLEKYPGLHGVQVDDALSYAKVPAGHSSHLVAPDLSLNVPGMHTLQDIVLMLLEKYPGLHGVQEDALPYAKVPAGQSPQFLASVHVPGMQVMLGDCSSKEHSGRDELPYVPGWHVMHCLSSSGSYSGLAL